MQMTRNVTDGSSVASILAIAVKLFGILSTPSSVFAWIGRTSVKHLTSVQQKFPLTTRAFLFVAPVERVLIIPIHIDASHATHETAGSSNTSKRVIATRSNFHFPDRNHGHQIQIVGHLVFLHLEFNFVPLSVIDRFEEIVGCYYTSAAFGYEVD
jgi:hypothetical protein